MMPPFETAHLHHRTPLAPAPCPETLAAEARAAEVARARRAQAVDASKRRLSDLARAVRSMLARWQRA